MNTFEVTVAICVYNGEKYIIETLNSLERQTFTAFNILIVDDACTDRTMELVREFISKHRTRKYRILSNGENRGLAVSRNIAMENITTPYVLFFDADDIAEPTMLEKMYSRLKQDRNLIAIGCYGKMIDSYGNLLPGSVRMGCTDPAEALSKAEKGKLVFMPPCSMFRQKFAIQAGMKAVKGFPNGFPRYADMCEDCDMWTRMSDFYVDGKYLLVIPEKLYRYRKHEKAISNNNYNMLIRMRHIKENVKRRRQGREEMTFIEFEKSLPNEEKKKLKKQAEAGKLLRDAGFSLHKKNFIQAVYLGGKAFFMDREYVVDKIRAMKR